MNVNELENMTLGYLGENEVTEVEFDFTEWVSEYGEGTLSLLFQRPSDEGAYPINLPQEDGIATWVISSTELSQRGEGKLQLVYVVNEQIKKSAVVKVFVNYSLADSLTPPSPYENWVEDVEQIKSEVEGMKDEAYQYSVNASESAQEARNEADRAQLIVDSMTLTTTYSNGKLTIGISEV